MNLQPLTAQDFAPGSPLPWPVFDTDGHLLFERGETLAVGYPMIGLCRAAKDSVPVVPVPVPVPEFNATDRLVEVPAAQLFPPDGIKPQMWEIVQLRLLGRGSNEHYFSRIIGYIKDISILVTASHLLRQPVAEGELIEVRMLTGRNIYVFRSEINKICQNPAPYIHLSFPGRVQCQPLRKAPWAKANLAAKIECEARRVSGMIVNLSAEGAQVDSLLSLGKEGMSVTLRFPINLDGMRREMALSARIMHVRQATKNKPDGEMSMLEHGIAFQRLTEQDGLWLRCLVYQRIAEGYLV